MVAHADKYHEAALRGPALTECNMNISSVNATVNPVGIKEKTAPPPTPEQVSDRAKVVQAVKVVNDSNTLGDNSEMTFVFDRTTHRTLTRVIDRITNEVLMQIPSEFVIRMAEQLKQNADG